MNNINKSCVKCPFLNQGGQNLLSAVFYIVIVGLYAPVVYEKVKGGLLDHIARICSPAGFFSVFAFAFYSKVFCDDLREGRTDKSRAIPFLFLSWLFFLAQVIFWHMPVVSAISFAIGMVLIMCSEHVKGSAFSRRMKFNMSYAIAAGMFALIECVLQWSDIMAFFRKILCAASECVKDVSFQLVLSIISYGVVSVAIVVLVCEIVQDYKKEVNND